MLKGLFGGGPGEQEVLKEQGVEGTKEDETQQTAPPTKEKKTNEGKKDMSTIPLEVNIVFSSLPPMTVAEKRASRDRLTRSFRSSILCLRFAWPQTTCNRHQGSVEASSGGSTQYSRGIPVQTPRPPRRQSGLAFYEMLETL